jgi:protein TIF31
MLELRKELNLKKVMKFEALVKEKEPVIFNTNVFKTAKLAMTESEIKAEEDKVKSLADYLKETAIPNLIKNLQKNEGSPTDS